MSRRRDPRSALARRAGTAAALALVVAGTLLVRGLTGEGGGEPPAAPPSTRPSVTASAGAPAGGEVRDGLPTVPVPELPPQARETLALIDAGGPFPYEQDGSVFRNREGLLPPEPRGCYREYTVETPGEDDRGARRIVTSCAGPRYWTADHYESFRRIVPARL